MRNWRWGLWTVLGLLAGCNRVLPPTAAHQAPRGADRPQLLVLVVVDQLRTDYLWRLQDRFVTGGFRWLLEHGANYPCAQWRHFPTFTGPGHACLATGAYPYQHGIVSNDWYDRDARRPVYCVADPSVRLVGEPSEQGARPMGPAHLRGTTLGDELRLASGGEAKVVSVALKDRAAVLMGGHLANAALWYDAGNGHWLSCNRYGKRLPDWAEAVNAQHLPDGYRGRRWEPLADPPTMRARGAFETLWGDPFAPPSRAVFADAINSKLSEAGDGFFSTFTSTPFANAFVLQTALAAVKAEQLGARGVTDLLLVSLSTNDYVGHRYGPNSWETLDITLQTDRALADFFGQLDQLVPGGLKACTVALTADHGVAPAPKTAADLGFQAGALPDQAIAQAATAALVERYGRSDLVAAWTEPYLYLERTRLAAAGLDEVAVEDAVVRRVTRLPGVASACSVTRLLRGEVPATEVGQRLARAVRAGVSGDVIVVLDPLWLVSEGKYATSHGQPYVYDSLAPVLLAGAGIKPGVDNAAVSPLDIAPTFARLANIMPPSGCEGRPLPCLR